VHLRAGWAVSWRRGFLIAQRADVDTLTGDGAMRAAAACAFREITGVFIAAHIQPGDSP